MISAAEMHLMQQRNGALLVLASAIAFGVMPIFGKLAFEAGVGVATLLVVRFAIAAPVLWGAVAVRRAFPRAGRTVLVRALALGAVGYAMQAGLYFLALERMDASVLSLVLYSYPALVTGAAILLGREAANRRRLVALVTASGGLVLVLVGAGAGDLDLAGMALGAGAALTYTTYILVSDGVTAELEALPLAALVSTGAALSLGVVAAATGTLDLGFDPAGWVWLGCAALVSTVAAVVLFFSGMSRVGPSTAAILSTLEPPVTVALVFLTFGEALGAVQLLGALAVLGAAVIVNLPSRAQVVTVSWLLRLVPLQAADRDLGGGYETSSQQAVAKPSRPPSRVRPVSAGRARARAAGGRDQPRRSRKRRARPAPHSPPWLIASGLEGGGAARGLSQSELECGTPRADRASSRDGDRGGPSGSQENTHDHAARAVLPFVETAAHPRSRDRLPEREGVSRRPARPDNRTRPSSRRPSTTSSGTANCSLRA